MKKSEARILIYIANVELRYRYGKQIALKLDMDYAYCLRILAGLNNKLILTKIKPKGSKTFYSIMNKSVIKKAKEIVQR